MAAQTGAYKVALTAATSTAVGGVLNITNPEGVDLIITRVIIHTTTKSTGAATLDIGIDDAGDTSNDTLFDGLDVGTAAGLFDNFENQGTNGVAAKLWPAGYHLVATASATVAGLVGYAYIEYFRK